MFPVVLNDGKQELPEDDIYYVIAKEGVFLKKKLGVMESLAPVKEISILQSITATAKMHIEKIPGPMFAKIIEFFRAVHGIHRGEAIVLLFYDEANKKYNIFPPKQKVSAGSVEYERGITIEGQTMIGTIHSHGSMSAFHSGVDDKDEESFDGLHITIGDVNDPEVSLSASICANGYRMMVDASDYVDKLKLTKDIDEEAKAATTTIYRWQAGKLVKDEKKTSRYSYNFRKYDKRYVVEVTDHQRNFNKKWLKVVEKGTYTYRRQAAGFGYGYGVYGGAYDGWGYNYDPLAWQGHRQVGPHRPPNRPGSNIVVVGKPGGKVPPQNVGPQKTPGIVFPEHEEDVEDFNPCVNCTWKEVKLDWALEQFTVETDEELDEDEMSDNFISGEDYDRIFNADDNGNIICHVCREKYHDSQKQCPACNAKKVENIMIPVSVNPLIGEEFSCPHCKTDFTHEGIDACPNCKEELDFSDFLKDLPQRAGASDEEIEVHSPGNLTPGTWYLCNRCTCVFEPHSDVASCPHCEEFMVDGYNCTPYNIEVERDAQMDKDAGGVAGKDVQKSEILEAAAEADKHIERIPDPMKPETPLSTLVQKTGKMSIKEMFKKTFGKGGA